MSKPQAKSLRAPDGMALMGRFAKHGGGLRMNNGGELPPGGSGNNLVSGASLLGTGSFQPLPMPQVGLGMRDGGELHLRNGGGGLVTGGHRSLLGSIEDMFSDFGDQEHIAGMPSVWTGGAPAQGGYTAPQVHMAPAPARAAPAPAMPGYAQRQGFTPAAAPTPTAAPQLHAYTTAAPGTTSAQNDSNAWSGVAPLKTPTHQEANAAFSAAQTTLAPAQNGLRHSANQFGDAAAQKEWGTPGRSNGRPSAQDMGAADGFAQRDAAKLAQVRSSGSFVTSPQQPMPGYSGSASGLPGIPGGKVPMNNFDRNQPATRQTPSISVSSNPSSDPMHRPGLRRGGELRTGHGGHVPGTGSGDKIPAKYEPGEFVVSNDMLDAQPELRQHLRGLREEVLAEKGMTPEQADAKAINGGRGLRAMVAGQFDFDELTGEPKPFENRSAGAANRSTAFDSEVTARAEAARAARATPGASPGAGAAPIPAAGAEPQSMFQRAKGVFTRAPKPDLRADPMAAAQAEEAAQWKNAGMKQPGQRAIGNAFRTASKGAKFLAPAVEAYDVAQVAMDPNSTKIDVGTQAAEGVSKLAGATAGGLAGAAAGGVFAPVTGLAGGIAGYYAPELATKALRWATGQETPSPAERVANAPKTPVLNTATPKVANPYEAANAAKLKAFAEANPPEAPAKLNDMRNVDNEAGTMEVFTKGRGGSVPGWTTVSTPEAKAQRLREAGEWKQEQAENAVNHRAALDRQIAYFEKANGANGGSKYAGLPHKTAAAMRVADAQAASQMATTQANNAVTREGNQMHLDAAMAPTRYAAQQRKLAGELLTQTGGDLGAATKLAMRYGVDPTHLQSAWSTDTTNRTAEQNMGDKARDGMAKEFLAYDPATGKANDDLSARRFAAVQKIMPGADLMSTEGRSKNLPEMQTLAKIFDRVSGSPQMGLDKINPLVPKGAARDAMPDLKGAKLVRQGLAGAITPGSSPNGYYLQTANGDVPLGADLSERELEIIRHATETGNWRGAPKKTQ